MQGTENDVDPMIQEVNVQILSGDLISFLTLYGRIINKSLGDIIGGE